MHGEHRVERGRVHYKWDNSVPPVVEVDPGDTVHFETAEVSDGQVTPGCPASDLAGIDPGRLYPLAGPVFVRDAEPGDAIEVEMLRLDPIEWGWTAIMPGRGLLAEDFSEPYIRHFDLANGQYAELRPDIRIPLQPFCGTMGVATDEPGAHAIQPPTKGAGNIDTRHLNVGARLQLPVFVQGALFSAGDCHAAQGDGEVSINGIECPMAFSLRFDVHKGAGLRPWSYRFTTPPGSLQSASDTAGYIAFTALGPDLMENAKNAIRDAIGWLGSEHGLSREDAYILCSLAADLKISQVVDRPNWGVSAYLPRGLFLY